MLENFYLDVHGLNPVVQAILRFEKTSACSAPAMFALPSEISCIQNEPNLAMDSFDFDVVVGALLHHMAKVLGAPGPLEASSFLILHEKAYDCTDILVEHGFLNVRTAAVRLGETSKLHCTLFQFVQQTFKHPLDGGTDLHWTHLASGFVGPLMRCPRALASFVKELESMCLLFLTESSETMKSKCSYQVSWDQELCVAVCDVHPFIARGLPVSTREVLSTTPMYAELR